MKVAFWSPLHGTGTTSSLLAIAATMGYKYDSTILLTQTHYNFNNLEAPLLNEKYGVSDRNVFISKGIDALIKYYKSGTLTDDAIDSCTIEIDDNLSLLTGTKQLARATYEDEMLQRLIGQILNCVEAYYEYLFIDVSSGASESGLKILQDADAIIVTLRQSKNDINTLVNSEVFKMLGEKKIFYILSEYDSNSKYNLKNLRSIYSFLNANNSVTIPYSTSYKDAIYDEKVCHFITSGLRNGLQGNDYFFTCVDKAADAIAALAEMKGGGK